MSSDRQPQEIDVDERITEDDGICSMSTFVMTGDPANVVSITKHRPLTDQERMYVLENSFNPHPRYKFPSRSISGSIRHFQRSWLDK